MNKQLPLLLNAEGIASLLGAAKDTVKGWRRKSLALVEHDPQRAREYLLPEDIEPGGRPLWYTRHVVDWAVQRQLLAQQHGLDVPDVRPVWSMADIAAHFDVRKDTVELRWRWHYTHAVKNKLPIPTNALCKEDVEIAGIPLWFPETVHKWGRERGKLKADNSAKDHIGSRWAGETVTVVIPPDPTAADVAAGRRWDRRRIAAEFGVKPRTVLVWHDFPKADAGGTSTGAALWWPATVRAWAQETGRVDAQGNLCVRKTGRPRTNPEPVRDVALQPGEVVSPFGKVHATHEGLATPSTRHTRCGVVVLMSQGGGPIDGWSDKGFGSSRCTKCDVEAAREQEQMAAHAA